MERFIGMAFRNVFRQKKRSFSLGLNYAIVTFILVLLFAFSQGAAVNIGTSLVKSQAGHITISGQYALGGRIFNGILRTPDISSAVKRVLGEGSVVLQRYRVSSTLYYKGLSKRLSFVGIDSSADTGLAGQMAFTAGSWADYASDPNGLILPQESAEYFGLSEGDEVVISTRTRFGAFNTGILKVRGIYRTDNFFLAGTLLTHFEFQRGLDLALPDASTTLYVYLPRAEGLAAKRDILAKALATQGFEVGGPKNDNEAIAAVSAASTKYEADKEGRDRVILTLSTLDEVLGLVKNVLAAVNAVGGIIALVMLFVIAGSIFINLRMSINERLREIGTMRAIGFESSGVTALFIIESVILSLIFSCAGAVLAVGLSALLRVTFAFPAGGNLGLFLDSGHLLLIPRPADIAMVIGTIAVFSAIFSFFPARKGGSIPPVEALTKVF